MAFFENLRIRGSNASNIAEVKAASTPPSATDPALVVADSPNRPATYSASITGISFANLATDVFTITGSATKVIKIIHMSLTGTQTAASIEDVILLRRSTANTGGTSTVLTNVTFDTTNPASTATVRAYTANPTLGTLVGNIHTEKVFVSTTATDPDIWEYEYMNHSQPITLRGINEVVAINLNGTTVVGDLFNVDITWTEE